MVVGMLGSSLDGGAAWGLGLGAVSLSFEKTPSGKCRSVVQGGPERSWSTKGGRGPHGPPGPLRSALIHTFGNFTENVDQGGSGWTRRTRGTITPLGGPGVVFTFC